MAWAPHPQIRALQAVQPRTLDPHPPDSRNDWNLALQSPPIHPSFHSITIVLGLDQHSDDFDLYERIHVE